MKLHTTVSESHTENDMQAVSVQVRCNQTKARHRLDRCGGLRSLIHETRNHISLLPVAAWKLKTEALSIAPGLVPHALRMERAALNCQALLQDLLRAIDGHDPILHFQRIRIDLLVAELLATLEPYLEQHHVQLRVMLKSGNRLIRADLDALRRVLINLIFNACEAMKTGGKLVVTTNTNGRQWISVTIQDTGSGIAPEALSQLGQFGYSTKPHGLGIGLYFCQQTIRAHRGTLTIWSRRGYGTRCVVRLPISNKKNREG